MYKQSRPLDIATFQRVQKWYLLALATIALTIIIAQILIQQHLNSQLNDSHVINVAGRQRAYGQKLVKEALLFQAENGTKGILGSELKKTLQVWEISHRGLQFGHDSLGLPKEDNPEILKLFQEITPYHTAMADAAKRILELGKDKARAGEEVAVLLNNERAFLNKMDAIVNEYDKRSKAQLEKLKYKEYVLLAISLAVLLLEILFIFRPLSFQIRSTIANLLKGREKSENDALEIKRLLNEKEKSLEALQELNFVIDNAALFASAKSDGSVVFISKKFLELLEYDNGNLNKPLSELLTSDEGQQEYLREVLRGKRRTIRSEEIRITTAKGKDLWLDMSIIPMHQSSREQSVLILCSDITERKRTQLKMEELTKQSYEESLRQKQLQASQIVEGQEEERKRIAKDIHDGIGQMLTALKFNIESIDLENKEKTSQKIAYLKHLASDLIKGVRTATFNLTPPELSDYGIVPALQKMTEELSKLTGKNILFENKTVEHLRFDSLAETNIYRVAQEAVNNAIKYAKANYILVTINHNHDMLSVVIDDDGKGFDLSKPDKKMDKDNEGGMGLFFMKERISYIDGRLFINSTPGKGTRITINYKPEKEPFENEMD